MAPKAGVSTQPKGLSIFERYLTLWVVLCVGGGIVLGKIAPGVARSLDRMAIYVSDAPVVSIPIAIALFFMMYPIMVKIDFAEVLRAGRSVRPVGLTLFINWAVKPFTMYAIALFFLGFLFRGLIGADALGVCPSNTKMAVFGGSKTPPGSLIVDPGAFYEVVF